MGECGASIDDGDGHHVCRYPRGHRPGDEHGHDYLLDAEHTDRHWCEGVTGHTSLPFGHWFQVKPAAHQPGDPHRYRIECEVCGQLGTIRLSMDPDPIADRGAQPGTEAGRYSQVLQVAADRQRLIDFVDCEDDDTSIRFTQLLDAALAEAHRQGRETLREALADAVALAGLLTDNLEGRGLLPYYVKIARTALPGLRALRNALYSEAVTHGYHRDSGPHGCREYVVGICALAADPDHD